MSSKVSATIDRPLICGKVVQTDPLHGWMDPQGDFHRVTNHADLATHTTGIDSDDWAIREMFNRGWIRVGPGWIQTTKGLSDSRFRDLKDLFLENEPFQEIDLDLGGVFWSVTLEEFLEAESVVDLKKFAKYVASDAVNTVLASWLMKKYPVVLSLDSQVRIQGFSERVSYTLGTLIRLSNWWSKQRATRCNSRLFRKDYKYNRYLFKVKCYEKWSKGPHVVIIQLLPGQDTKVSNREVRVSCSCPFWVYMGPLWNSSQKNYLHGRPPVSPTSPTKLINLKRKAMICKHVAASASVFNRLLPLDVEQVI
jgi:hypothetical protein